MPKQNAPWYEMFKGNRRFLPLSQRQGEKMVQEQLAPLMAQIAVFFGKGAGDLSTLQRGCMAVKRNEIIICEACQRDIWNRGHKKDCELVVQYDVVIKSVE